MKTNTRAAFNKILVGMAAAYGVGSMSDKFDVSPQLEQTLQDQITEQATFLTMVHTEMVEQGDGETVFGGVSGTVTSTTNTKSGNKRKPRNVLGLTGSQYKCNKVHSDVFIHYDDLDAWVPKFPNLHDRYRGWVQQAIANDRLLIGWNGTHYAEDSDVETYPMLQDCNIGWLQVLRDQKPENVIDEIVADAGVIKIGGDGDYVNLDMAVDDALQLIPTHLRKDLVVLIGGGLLAADKAKLYEVHGSTPTEKQAIELQAVNGTYAGMKAYSPEFFPNRGIMITSLKNLVIMIQKGTWRRRVEDSSDSEAIIDWNGRRECYGISVMEACVYVESDNVRIKNSAGDWV
jgi:P2 family phage major capsid protein